MRIKGYAKRETGDLLAPLVVPVAAQADSEFRALGYPARLDIVRSLGGGRLNRHFFRHAIRTA